MGARQRPPSLCAFLSCLIPSRNSRPRSSSSASPLDPSPGLRRQHFDELVLHLDLDGFVLGLPNLLVQGYEHATPIKRPIVIPAGEIGHDHQFGSAIPEPLFPNRIFFSQYPWLSCLEIIGNP